MELESENWSDRANQVRTASSMSQSASENRRPPTTAEEFFAREVDEKLEEQQEQQQMAASGFEQPGRGLMTLSSAGQILNAPGWRICEK